MQKKVSKKKNPYRNPGELLLKTTQELQEALAKKKMQNMKEWAYTSI